MQDWLGRCIAESKVSAATQAVTLTYGPDDRIKGEHDQNVDARLLNYRHIQLFLKNVRRNIGRVRFVCAGEYGSAKGRAHWHLIMFWPGKPPNVPIRTRFNWEPWEHGYSFIDDADQGAIQYVCKYIAKGNVDPEAKDTQGLFGWSKVPALGSGYFDYLAGQLVEHRLPLRDGRYGWPEIRNRQGKQRWFYAKKTLALRFAQSYVQQWRAKYGDDSYPDSDFVTRWLDVEFRRDRVIGEGDPDFDRKFTLEHHSKSIGEGRWPGSVHANQPPPPTENPYAERYAKQSRG